GIDGPGRGGRNRGGPPPAGWQYLTNHIGARGSVREDVAPVGIGDGARLARIERAVVVGIEINRPSGQPRLAGVADAVVVGVVEDLARYQVSRRHRERLPGVVRNRIAL